NTVERGDPVGPWGDRLHHVCALEVVLPTGELVHTGFARFPEARAAHLHRWGVGPALDGLFTQSNLGIVTRMTMWLVPRPAFFESFACTIDGRDALSRFLDAAQPLLLRGALPGYTLTLWNSYKVLASCPCVGPWRAAASPAAPRPPAALPPPRAGGGGGGGAGHPPAGGRAGGGGGARGAPRGAGRGGPPPHAALGAALDLLGRGL